MSRLLKIRALAHRALWQIGRTGHQSAVARQQRAEFYSGAWKEAAAVLNADVEELDRNTLAMRKAGASTRVHLNYTPLDDPVTLRIAGNKPVVHRLLRQRGIPVPAFREFTLKTISEAAGFLRTTDTCVVKPASGTGGGQGVTTGIKNRRHLQQAAVFAAGHGSGLMIEEQLAGNNLRLLLLDGELLDAIERRPPTVIGDGRSTVRALVGEMNAHRLQTGTAVAQSIVKQDQDMQRTLAAQGHTLRSVPGTGQAVQLKTVINDNAADENVNVTETVHAAIIAAARQASAAVGLRLAGVDIVTTDHRRDLSETGGVVLEVNSTPGLYFHYGRAAGRTKVAVPILATCLGCSVEKSQWTGDSALTVNKPAALITGSSSC